jgi:hypothetical protein
MSVIHSIGRGLPGNKYTRLTHPGGAVEGAATVVESPPEVRRRVVSGTTAGNIAGNQSGTLTGLRLFNPGLISVLTSEVRLVTPDGSFVVEVIGGIAAGVEKTLSKEIVIRDDEYLEYRILTADVGAVTVDCFATFADLRSTEVGRERVKIPASGVKVVVVPEPTSGRMHLPWDNSTGAASYYGVVAPGAGGGDVSTFLNDDGNIVECGAVVLTAAVLAVAEPLQFGVREIENQSLLASYNAEEGEDAYAFTTYLIVPDPKVGQPGNSA